MVYLKKEHCMCSHLILQLKLYEQSVFLMKHFIFNYNIMYIPAKHFCILVVQKMPIFLVLFVKFGLHLVSIIIIKRIDAGTAPSNCSI